MPIPEQGPLTVFVNLLCLIGLDCQLSEMADIAEVSSHSSNAPAAAGHFDHDLRCPLHGAPDVLDLLAREASRLWTRPTGAEEVEKRSPRGR
jgi:hypothetical protein